MDKYAGKLKKLIPPISNNVIATDRDDMRT